MSLMCFVLACVCVCVSTRCKKYAFSEGQAGVQANERAGMNQMNEPRQVEVNETNKRMCVYVYI